MNLNMRNLCFIIGYIVITLFGSDCEEANYTIKKCSCEWYQIQVENGSCVDHNITYIHVFNTDTNIGNDIHLSEVANVVVSPLICPSADQKVVLRGLALLSQHGQLLPTPEPPTDDYCIENFINIDGTPSQLYEFCVSYDPFSLCCEFNQTINDKGECGEPYSPFPTTFDYVVENVQCAHEEPAHIPVPMDGNLITMKNIFGYYNAQLYSDQLPKSCLATYITDGVPTYFKKYCECEDLTCIEGCCPVGESFILETTSCEPSSYNYSPVNIYYPENVKLISRSMPCNNSYVLDFSEMNHSVLVDGSLSSKSGKTLPIHHFCLGLVTTDNVTQSSGLGCVIEKPEDTCMWRFTVIQVFLIISSIFIVLTIGVYMSVRDLRSRTGGAWLISELIAMLISQVLLIIIQTNQEKFSPQGCLAAGVLELIFVLASFFWLNIMCFDMWTTFREVRSFSQKLMNVRRYLKYSLYGWGIPILIGMVVVAVELLDGHPRPYFTPHDGCFFNSYAEAITAQWIYLYGFVVLLLLANTLFFVHVIYKIKLLPMKSGKNKFGSKNVKGKESLNTDIESAKLYGKLFIIMGLPWIIEAFSSFASDSDVCYLWILDIINLIRGILIFVIFVCKKTTREKVMKSWSPSKQSSDINSADRSRKTSNMSLTSWLSSYKTSTTRSMKPIEEDVQGQVID